MSVNELKAKYGRIANDPSQLEMFKDDVIEGKTTGFPELPEGAEGKTLVLQMQDGELSWKDASPVVRKGDVIKLAGEEYRVLSVNEDLTDCEVVRTGPVTFIKFRDTSAGSDPSAAVTFMVDGVETTGLKYEGSNVDQTCEAFYEGLPDEIKDAIIEQEVVQDMYNTKAIHATEDFKIDNTGEGITSVAYRFKKINDASVTVGIRHAYALSCIAIKEYFGGTSARGVDVANIFPLQSWFKDAINSVAAACDFNSAGDGCGVDDGAYNKRFSVCPAFHINLTLVNL